MKKGFILTLLCLMLFNGVLLYADDPIVRVRIIYTLDEIILESDSKISIYDQDDERKQLRGKQTFSVVPDQGDLVLRDSNNEPLQRGSSLLIKNHDANSSIKIKQVPYGIGWWWAGTEDRSYHGSLEFYINENNQIDVINVLDIETYLYGVVPSEIGVTAPIEALKAQAVCARSEAMVGLQTGKYAGPHYTLTADVMCQVYSGNGKMNNAVRDAVNATKGEVLVYHDTIISAYYSSNCGGHTENIENVWPERSTHKIYWSGRPDMDEKMSLDLTQADDIRTWIESEPDSWCKPGDITPDWSKKHFRWQRSITPEILSAVVAEQHRDIGRIYDIIPLERGVSGRIYDILFVGDGGYCRVKGELNIRRLVNTPLKSSCFIIDKIGPVSKPVSFIISGAGWGHGVGMCQTGAIARANSEWKYKDILGYYFRESTIQREYK